MRIVIAVFSGLVVTGVMVFGGDWAIGRLAEASTAQTYSGADPVHAASLLWKAISMLAGALTAARIKPAPATVTAFIVGQAFFGSGMLDEHSIVRTLLNFAALLLVIPAAMLATRITPLRQHAF